MRGDAKIESQPHELALRMLDKPRAALPRRSERASLARPRAVRGRKVCRFHGARGGAPTGPANGAWRHGLHTNEAVAERRRLNDLVRDAKMSLRQLFGREQ